MSIGIFWKIKHQIHGGKTPLHEAEETLSNLLDSPLNHSDYWDDQLAKSLGFFSDPDTGYPVVEYYEFPRGRVIYSITLNKFYIYMDKQLFNNADKKLIRQFFDIGNEQKVTWKSDNHYRIKMELKEI